LFVGFAGYYATVRTRINAVVEESAQFDVDARVDVEFVKLLVTKATVGEMIVFRNWFKRSFQCRYFDSYGIEAWKAFLLMVSMALMNVSDMTGLETMELIPFIEIFLDHDFFSESIRFLSVMIFDVAIRNDFVSKVQERTVLLLLLASWQSLYSDVSWHFFSVFQLSDQQNQFSEIHTRKRFFGI
jgi:hypothetical protein